MREKIKMEITLFIHSYISIFIIHIIYCVHLEEFIYSTVHICTYNIITHFFCVCTCLQTMKYQDINPHLDSSSAIWFLKKSNLDFELHDFLCIVCFFGSGGVPDTLGLPPTLVRQTPLYQWVYISVYPAIFMQTSSLTPSRRSRARTPTSEGSGRCSSSNNLKP